MLDQIIGKNCFSLLNKLASNIMQLREIKKSRVMKQGKLISTVALAILLGWQAGAQIYYTNNVVVQTFAGSGFVGWLDGQGTQTMFNNPTAVASDSSSNLFVLDWSNVRIRKITPDGNVSTFAGGGNGVLPGYGTNVYIPCNAVMTIDHSNALWAPNGSYLIRVGSDAYVSKIVPNLPGNIVLHGICFDSVNNMYCSDAALNYIYRCRTNGIWEIFVGSGNRGSADGNGVFTSFSMPESLVADAADNIYVWDAGNALIRRISQNRDVVTIAGKQGAFSDSDGVGTNASFSTVWTMVADNSGNIYFGCGSSIRRMDAITNVVTIAGSFTQGGYTNGAGAIARFNLPRGLCLSQGVMFVADSSNERIRNITFNPAPQVVSPANLQLNTYAGLRIVGSVGRTYQIQTSPDLNNWSAVTTLLLTSSPYLWIDQNSVNGNTFYRALLLP